MKSGMTAKRLRAILLVIMLLIIAATVGGFVYAQKSLREYATTISGLNADANSGDQNIQTLKTLERTLSEKQFAVEQAKSIVADSSTYTDRSISDITRIAGQSGVTLSSFEFVDTTNNASGAAPAQATTTTPTPATTPATTAPAGVTKKSISVTLSSPLKYANLIKFIEGIETNSLKMQISNISITKDKGDMVGTQPFNIEVYVRQ